MQKWFIVIIFLLTCELFGQKNFLINYSSPLPPQDSIFADWYQYSIHLNDSQNYSVRKNFLKSLAYVPQKVLSLDSVIVLKKNIQLSKYPGSFVFNVNQIGVSKWYLDDSLISILGKNDFESAKRSFNKIRNKTIVIPIRDTLHHTLTIHISPANYFDYFSDGIVAFSLTSIDSEENKDESLKIFLIILSIVFTLATFHLLFYLFYRYELANLIYSIFLYFIALDIFCIYLIPVSSNMYFEFILNYVFAIFSILTLCLLSIVMLKFKWINSQNSNKLIKKIVYLNAIFFILTFISIFLNAVSVLFIIWFLFNFFAMMYSSYVLIKNSLRDINQQKIIILIGFLIFLAYLLITPIVDWIINNFQEFGFSYSGSSLFISFMAIPISMSLSLASDFASINFQLKKSIEEIKILSEKNIQQEKEKQKILEEQNLTLEKLVKDRTKEIEEQKKIIEMKNKDIMDSINYASRIQQTLVQTNNNLIDKLKLFVKDYFVLFKPKDVVSGDFYWTYYEPPYFFLAVCDSTGHGIPGAFMSLLNIGLLNESIKTNKIFECNKVFETVRTNLIKYLNESQQQDGMDGILMMLTESSNTITYATAHNVPILIRNHQIQELPYDKIPVGYYPIDKHFHLYTLNVQEGDCLYLSTDGYVDQFGGEKNKKLGYKRFEEFLLKIHNESMNIQKQQLITFFEKWKNNNDQTDDICIFGLKF